MSAERTQQLRRRLSRTDDQGRLKARESSDLEYKETFSLGSLSKYAKLLAGFANAKGGFIVFGVKDHPRKVTGVRADRFDAVQIEKIQESVSAFLSPELAWEIDSLQLGDKTVGYIYVAEAEEKPVICKVDRGNDLKNGEIYYRYRGRTKVIGFPELKRIHNEIRDRERALWMAHVERIGRIGPRNVAFLDLFEGRIESASSSDRLIIDRELLDQIKSELSFVESGRFLETKGRPTLRLVGELAASDNVIVPSLDPERDYPFVVQTLADELQIRRYDVQVLVWKLGLKGDARFHTRISTGRTSKVDKYTKLALREIQNLLFDHKDDRDAFLVDRSREYQRRTG